MIKKHSAEKPMPVNLKEKNAIYSFRITIRDREHFYKLVNWLNTNVGKGQDKWTMEGRVLKSLKVGKSANPKIYIFKEDFDESSSLYLSLL
jgi:hypothetical protein